MKAETPPSRVPVPLSPSRSLSTSPPVPLSLSGEGEREGGRDGGPVTRGERRQNAFQTFESDNAADTDRRGVGYRSSVTAERSGHGVQSHDPHGERGGGGEVARGGQGVRYQEADRG